MSSVELKDKYKETIRCMSEVMTDIANELGIPAEKHGDPDEIFHAIEVLKEQAYKEPAPKETVALLGRIDLWEETMSKDTPSFIRGIIYDARTALAAINNKEQK